MFRGDTLHKWTRGASLFETLETERMADDTATKAGSSPDANSLLLLSSLAKNAVPSSGSSYSRGSGKRKRTGEEPTGAIKKTKEGSSAGHKEAPAAVGAPKNSVVESNAPGATPAKGDGTDLDGALPSATPAKSEEAKEALSEEEIQKIKRKRATHNATEKRRQARISMQFLELKKLIEQASGQTIRRGRGQILAATLLFMGAVLQENLTLRKSLNQLLISQQMGQSNIANHMQVSPPPNGHPPPLQTMLQYPASCAQNSRPSNNVHLPLHHHIHMSAPQMTTALRQTISTQGGMEKL